MKVFRYSYKKIGNYFCHKVYVTKTGFETDNIINTISLLVLLAHTNIPNI